VRAVFDIAASRQLALAEAAQEFMQRYRQSQRGAQALSAASSSSAAAATAASAGAVGGDAMDLDAPAAAAAAAAAALSSSTGSGVSSGYAAGPLPMLASACPGWVCYAEKTHGEHVLPYISTGRLQQRQGCFRNKTRLEGLEGLEQRPSKSALRSRPLDPQKRCPSKASPCRRAPRPPSPAGKSPQAVMGSLVKRRWCSAAGLAPAQVYHCAVMPCYDKKLEAAREDFWLPGGWAAAVCPGVGPLEREACCVLV
jgi:iron only hydrogenase large subunit-like protein